MDVIENGDMISYTGADAAWAFKQVRDNYGNGGNSDQKGDGDDKGKKKPNGPVKSDEPAYDPFHQAGDFKYGGIPYGDIADQLISKYSPKAKKLTDAELQALKSECTKQGLIAIGSLFIPYEKIAAYGGEGIAWLMRAASLGGSISELGAIGALTGRFYSSEVLAGMLSESTEGYTTIYRGLTGSEGGTGPLFLAEDEAYAAGFAKQGVASFSIPSQTFRLLLKENLIETLNGVNQTTGQKGLEYFISNPAVKEAILKIMTKLK